ncbi:MAG: endonuclease/exonuclease/phosphatase family protein [Methanothrix sp.]|nr:endonuclease/exonuclease/phosphatase family protein [Methanothrix sp.]
MKIVSWNCKMAFRNKLNYVQGFNPDIVVVPECENFGKQTTKCIWFGENRSKGIGIFSYSDFEIELSPDYNASFKYIIPLIVKGPTNFNLLAVWAMNDSIDIRKRYIGQVWLAINYYKELLEGPLIIIGDFNWNKIWDAKPKYPLYGNLIDVIEILKDKEIKSAYHSFYEEEFGKETRPTLFMHHNKNKSYHVDYCFASKNFKLENVEIGEYSDWAKKSDHMPLMITFNERQF